MYNLEKSPGMFSDCPGTTPKSLDLVISPACLREKERELLDEVCGLVGGVRGTPIISQVWPTPSFCPVSDCPPMNFYTDTRLKLPLPNSSQHRRTVRGPLEDRPQCNFAVENFSAEPLVNKSHESLW